MKICKEIYQYRQMIFSLVKKDLRGRYKGSVLGFLWTFINPLMQLVVYTFVFTYIMKAGIEKYYLYLFVALIPWIFFSSAITGGSSSIVAQKDLIKKIYFPREVIPISYDLRHFAESAGAAVPACGHGSGILPGAGHGDAFLGDHCVFP